MIAAMAPSWAAPAFAIFSARIFTRDKPVSKSKALATDNEEYSPKLCPATAFGEKPFAFNNSPSITETI